MDKITGIQRIKEVYTISQEEFLTGEWLKRISDSIPTPNKIDVQYRNGYLIIMKYIKEGGE